MRLLAFAVATLAWGGCTQLAASDGQASAEPEPIASPAWSYSADGVFHSEMAAGVLMLGGTSWVTALDPATGKVLWKNTDGASAFGIAPNLIVYGDPAGSVILRKRAGELVWKRSGVCSSERLASERFAGFTAITYGYGNVLAGCGGGKLTLLDGQTGAVLAQSAAFTVSQVSGFQPLGSCAYAVSGWSGGAALVNSVMIVGCKDLKPIMGSRNDVTVLGMSGDEAIVDDWCCFGRPNVYEPATIFRKNLKTGDLSPKIDLAPQPERYPAGTRPIGQNAQAFLVRTDVLLSVETALYDYGPPDALASPPALLADGLSARPIQLPEGRMLLQTTEKDGTVTFNVVGVDHGKLQSERTWTARPGFVTTYRPETGDGDGLFESFLSASMRYMRVSDGARVYTQKNCPFLAGDSQTIVKRCESKIGSYIEAYRWPRPPAGAIAQPSPSG